MTSQEGRVACCGMCMEDYYTPVSRQYRGKELENAVDQCFQVCVHLPLYVFKLLSHSTCVWDKDIGINSGFDYFENKI